MKNTQTFLLALQKIYLNFGNITKKPLTFIAYNERSKGVVSMNKVTVLNENDLRKILTMEETIAAVEEAYKQKELNKAFVLPMIFHEFEAGVADMDIKAGVMPELERYGLKVVSWFKDNPAKNLPALFGTTLLFDSKTGAPCSLLDAEYITGMRTGAAGAIGAKYLAKKMAKTLLIIGSGQQAFFQIAAYLTVFDSISDISIFDPLDANKANAFVTNLATPLESLLAKNPTKKVSLKNTNVSAVTDLAQTLEKSDLVATVTPATTPIIKAKWVKKGTHFSCIGADISGKEEIDPQIFKDAIIIVDDLQQAITVGETERPIKEGVIKKADISGEIGALITGKVAGRTADDAITIFDSTGIALQDLAVSNLALKIATKENIGQTVFL